MRRVCVFRNGMCMCVYGGIDSDELQWIVDKLSSRYNLSVQSSYDKTPEQGNEYYIRRDGCRIEVVCNQLIEPEVFNGEHDRMPIDEYLDVCDDKVSPIVDTLLGILNDVYELWSEEVE